MYYYYFIRCVSYTVVALTSCVFVICVCVCVFVIILIFSVLCVLNFIVFC
jgi:hypothetical protein